jgi:hypothetical protein
VVEIHNNEITLSNDVTGGTFTIPWVGATPADKNKVELRFNIYPVDEIRWALLNATQFQFFRQAVAAKTYPYTAIHHVTSV